MTGQPITLAQELRAATREAHGVLKDLHAARRTIEQLIEKTLPERIEALITASVTSGLEALGVDIRQAQEMAVKKIMSEFDRLAAILGNTTRTARAKGEPSLEDIVRRIVRATTEEGT